MPMAITKASTVPAFMHALDLPNYSNLATPAPMLY